MDPNSAEVTAARVVAVLMQGLALWAVWGTLRCFVAERAARLGVLPGLAFWSFVTYEDYIHYSTELPGLLLIAWAGWAIAAIAWRRRIRVPPAPRHGRPGRC